MAWDAHDKRLWRSVKPVVSARKDDRGRIMGLGTAFVCGQDGATSYLLTCWHVVEAIGADHLRVLGRKARVVALGDEALDLALLAVDDLPEPEILKLSDVGYADQPFRTIGHFWADEKKQNVADSRPLNGRLGEERRKSSDRYSAVVGWEFKILVEDEVFDRILEGYSGAPVFDPASSLVIAVISHKVGDPRGKAVAVSNLTIIHPPAEAFFDHSKGDEGGGRDPWIVKTLDHEQVPSLRDRLRALDSPKVAVVEGCTDDWPTYLADDVFLDPWPALDDIPQEATTLNPARYGEGESAFWSALHHCVPAPQQAIERDTQRDAVRAWLRERDRDRHLFCVSVSMVDNGWHLPHLIRAAQTFLDQLSRCESGMRLLILIVCLSRHDRSPWWWPLWRWYLKRIPGVRWLAPLRPLEGEDLQIWCDGFSGDAKRKLHCERLREALLDLLQDGRRGVRYRLVRRRLLEGGALEKARIRP